MDLRERLDAWRIENGWSIQRLADAVGVHQGLASKWLSYDPKRRVTPRAANLKRLAEVTGIPYPELRDLADPYGETEPTDPAPPNVSRIELLIRRRTAELREIAAATEGLPDWAAEVWLDKVLGRAADELREALPLLRRLRAEPSGGAVNGGHDGAVNAPVPPANTPAEAARAELSDCFRPVKPSPRRPRAALAA